MNRHSAFPRLSKTLGRCIVAVTVGMVLSGVAAPAFAQITVGGNGSDTTDSTSYSGTQSLTKIGSNTVSLTGNNSYTGGSFVNSGTLNLSGGYSSNGNFTIDTGAGLRVTAANLWFYGTPAFAFASGGGGVIDTSSGVNFIMGGNSTYTSAGGAMNQITGASGINLNSTAATFNVARGTGIADLVVAGGLWNTGTITKTGNGILNLAGDSSYSGPTTINGGRMLLGTGSTDLRNWGSNVAINNGSTLAFAGSRFDLTQSAGAARTITFGTSGGGTIDTGTGLNLVDWVGSTYATTGGARNFITGSSGFNTTSATITLNVSRGTDPVSDLSIDSRFWNAGNVTKTGNGVVTFTGSNANSGGTTITAGTVQVGDGGMTGQLGPGGIINNAALIINRSGAVTFGQIISGTGSLTHVGTGTTTISGSVAYTGPTTINAGRLVLESGAGSVGQSSGYAINNGATLAFGGVRYDLNSTGGAARTITFGTSGGGTIDTGTTNLPDWVGNTYATTGGAKNFITGSMGLNVNSGVTATFNVVRGTDPTSDLTIDSRIWNAGGITKTGNGILTFTGSTTYSGATTVSAGKLVVNGVTSTSPMTVSAGATLGGSGTVGGVTTIAGVHSPGNSPGVQTFASDLTYQAGSGMLWELAANTTGTGSFDQVILPSGNLAFSGSTAFTMAFDGAGSTVDWANAFWNVNRSWLVYDLGSGVTTGFGNLTLGGSLLDSLGNTLSPTGRGYFTLGQGGQDVVLNFTAVPEPSTAALAAIGALGAGIAISRRKRGRPRGG